MKDLKFTDAHRDFLLQKIKVLRYYHSISGTLPEKVIKPLVDDFRNHMVFRPFLTFYICFDADFERYVINKSVNVDGSNSRLTKYSEIKYPPSAVAHKLGFNRASLPGQSIFYAGYGNLTATLETKPQLGDLYTHSKWRQKPGTKIVYVPIFHKDEILQKTDQFNGDWEWYHKYLKTLDKNVAIVVQETMDFLATVFTTKVNPGNKQEYLISALMADLILNNSPDEVDCLFYPSVASGLISPNIALKPRVLEEKFDLIELSEDFCFFSEADRQFLGSRTGVGINLNPQSETIIWENENHELPDFDLPGMMRHFKVKF